MRLEGVVPPLTTPFEDGVVSPARLRDNIARYERDGVDGYLLLGSTGEAPLLDEDEKLGLLRAAREAIPPGKPLLAGVGLESTRATIRLARRVADCGADLLLVLTPHYFGAQMDAAALAAHYRAVADEAPAPVLLYDVPKFTRLQIPLDTVLALAAHENIRGIKDSGGDLERLKRLLRDAPEGFEVICGHAGIVLDALRAGCRAAILAAADALPERFVAIHRLAAGAGDDARRAERLHAAAESVVRLVVSTHGVPGIKAAMDLRGLYGGSPRPPLLPVSDDTRRQIAAELAALDDDGVQE